MCLQIRACLAESARSDRLPVTCPQNFHQPRRTLNIFFCRRLTQVKRFRITSSTRPYTQSSGSRALPQPVHCPKISTIRAAAAATAGGEEPLNAQRCWSLNHQRNRDLEDRENPSCWLLSVRTNRRCCIDMPRNNTLVSLSQQVQLQLLGLLVGRKAGRHREEVDLNPGAPKLGD